MKTPALMAVFAVLVGSFVWADDWPQFRGADRTGVSKETGLLKAWPKAGPKLAWTFKDAGMGHSSFAVAKGVVYTLGTDMKRTDDIIIAIDEKSGTLLWTHKIGPMFNFMTNIWGEGPRSTPTIDGNLLFALGGDGDLVCIDLADKHKELWRKNLVKDFKGEMMSEWGFSESPLVDGDNLIVTPGGQDGTLACLEKKTGKLIWRSVKWTDTAPYSSVIVAEIHKVRQYIQTGYINDKQNTVIAGIDAKNGNLLWTGPILTKEYNVSVTPIVKGNLVYATSAHGGGCHLFEIDKNQKATEQYAKPLQKKVNNDHGGVVLIGDHVYGQSKMWFCQDLKTGAVEWTERNKLECISGAITAADGKLYVFTDDGEVGLVDANPKKQFALISQFKLPERSKLRAASKTAGSSKTWAHPVVSNGRLYLRDHELIFAYEIK